MSTFKVVEDRNEVTRGSEVKSLLFGYHVFEYDEDGNKVQQMNQSVLGQQQARELAATLTWMVHLDRWMTTVVEDADVVDEIGDILDLDFIPIETVDENSIVKAYDRRVAEALKLLPTGLRRLADRYEREWQATRV